MTLEHRHTGLQNRLYVSIHVSDLLFTRLGFIVYPFEIHCMFTRYSPVN